MATGAYDHPTYLTRQMFSMGTTTAGANGTSGRAAWPSDMRVRKITAVLATAGTATTHTVSLLSIGTIVTGYNLSPVALTTSTATNTVGTLTLSTGTANAVLTSTDMNTLILAGTALFLKNGADATGVAAVVAEMNIDPGSSFT